MTLKLAEMSVVKSRPSVLYRANFLSRHLYVAFASVYLLARYVS